MALVYLVCTGSCTPYEYRMDEARRARAKADLKALDDAIRIYKTERGDYPRTLDDLFPAGRAPYLAGCSGVAELRDPWGQRYGYTAPAAGSSRYDLVSYGEDGLPGGTGHTADIHLRDVLSGTSD